MGPYGTLGGANTLEAGHRLKTSVGLFDGVSLLDEKMDKILDNL